MDLKNGPALQLAALHPHPGSTVRLQLSLRPEADLVEVTEDRDPDEHQLILGPEQLVIPDGWDEATTQTVALLDRLLIAHRSVERAWVVYGGGNEGILWFATDQQAALINSALPDREKLAKVCN